MVKQMSFVLANGVTAVNSKGYLFNYASDISIIGQSTVDGDGGCNAKQQDDDGRENCRQSVQNVHRLCASDVQVSN